MDDYFLSLTNVHGLSCHRYAIRESNSVVKIFKNFKEKKSFKPDFGAEGKWKRPAQVVSSEQRYCKQIMTVLMEPAR
jgi:hypothetical protein